MVKVFKSKEDKQWHWHVTAGNNRILGDSGEGYKNKADCVKGFNLFCGEVLKHVAANWGK